MFGRCGEVILDSTISTTQIRVTCPKIDKTKVSKSKSITLRGVADRVCSDCPHRKESEN